MQPHAPQWLNYNPDNMCIQLETLLDIMDLEQLVYFLAFLDSSFTYCKVIAYIIQLLWPNSLIILFLDQVLQNDYMVVLFGLFWPKYFVFSLISCILNVSKWIIYKYFWKVYSNAMLSEQPNTYGLGRGCVCISSYWFVESRGEPWLLYMAKPHWCHYIH